MNSKRTYCLALLLAVLTSQADAQWTVVNLHPFGATASWGYGVSGGQQVGQVLLDDYHHAGMWTGSAASWTDLNPQGSFVSTAYAVDGGQQGGQFDADFFSACIWSSTAASWVNLHPAGSGKSAVFGVHAGQQVGFAILGGIHHASLWSGTASSWVSLNPAGSNEAWAKGIHNGQQVGQARFVNSYWASLWTSTPTSWVNLNPPGSTASDALGVFDGQQVGYVRMAGIDRACLWNGTALSWQDLHPPGSGWSQCSGVFDGVQTGYAQVGSYAHASVWTGTADSWVDLHPYLPPGFVHESYARGVWHDQDFTYVVGHAFNFMNSRQEALMWTAAHKFGPTGFSIFRGTLVSGGVPELTSSDDLRLLVRNGFTLSTQESPITVRFDVVAPFAAVSDLKVRLESQVSTIGLEQGIDLFDYTINDWVNVDARNASSNTDSVVVVTVSNPNRFIQAGTRAMRAQVRYRRIGLTLSSNWQAKLDQVRWELTP